MEPLATEPLVVLASASPIVGELLGEKRIVVCHSATGHASRPRRMSAPRRGIERHPRSLTDPLFAAYTDATVELRAGPHATASGAESALTAVSLVLATRPLRACALATTADAFHATRHSARRAASAQPRCSIRLKASATGPPSQTRRSLAPVNHQPTQRRARHHSAAALCQPSERCHRSDGREDHLYQLATGARKSGRCRSGEIGTDFPYVRKGGLRPPRRPARRRRGRRERSRSSGGHVSQGDRCAAG